MKKTTFYFSDAEWHFVVHSLNMLRNDFIQAGKFTDVIDETLAKVINAPVRKIKVS